MKIIDGPITSEITSEVIDKNRNADMGAHALFLGQVRADMIDNKKVLEIEYSAYDDMVMAEADKIEKHIVEKYDQVTCVEIYHSIGKVKAGELSLFVFVSSGHRKQSFNAIEECVEMIKDNLPVWKREVFDDGEYVWTENKK